MLATFADSAPTLNITLQANEAVQIVSNGTTYTMTLASGTWSGSTDPNVTASGSTLTVTSAGQTAFSTGIDITDDSGSGGGTGTSVSFIDSGVNAYVNHFTIDLHNSPATPGLAFSGNSSFGANTLDATINTSVLLNSGADVSTSSGDITLNANQQATATSGNFIGVDVNNALIKSATGAITLAGKGGNSGSGNDGVEIQAGGQVQATGGSPALISITGASGDGASAGILFANGAVASTGDVTLTGAGGSITGSPGNGGANVTGATVSLTTTGAGNQIGTAAPAGSPDSPLKVNATTLLNAATTDGFITIANTTGNLPLGELNAGAALIELTTVGAITDGNNGAGAPNLTAANGAVLTTTGSNSAIGTAAHPIRTAIGALTATTHDGGVYISDSNGPGLIINSILAMEGGYTPVINGSNQIVLKDSNGNDIIGTDNVSVTATGPILLASVQGVATTVAAPNAVTIDSTGGGIVQGTPGTDNVLGRSVNLMASGSVGVAGGAIGLTVENFSASTTNGGIFLGELIPGRAVSVVAGGAGNDVSVTGSGPTLGIGVITAPGTVTLEETGGALLSSTGMNVSGQTVKLTGQAGIGSSGSPFTITAANLSATAKVPGAGIFVNDTTGLSTVSATTNAGAVAITYAGGSLNFTASTGLLTAAGGAVVSIENKGGNVVLGAVYAANITASGAITADPTVNLTGGTVTLTAGAGIGATGSPIKTNVTALNATTTAGDIVIVQAANPLTVNAKSQGYSNPSAQTGSDISVTATAGDLTAGKVSALGTVTLNAGGAILVGTGAPFNVIANTLALTAANGIGASASVLQTSVSTLTANGGAGGGVFLSNSKTLALTSASATGGDVNITTLGDLNIGSVTAAGQSVTLSATGALIDPSGPALNITAQSATLSGSSIGSASDQLETQASSITATAAVGGIYISDLGTGTVTLTATAAGQGSDIDFTSAGSIVLMTVTAKGNTVTLNAAGSITNGLTSPGVNITAQTLNIVAPGGIGTSANPLEILVAQIAAADGGAPGAFMHNAGPVAITASALEAPGTGTLTFDAASITILDLGSTPVSLAPGRSLLLKTDTGPIVFLNPADTIETSNGGTITVEAGTTPGSGGVAVLGNLTTAGGNINVTADYNITIGLLNAGTGNVTVQSASGIILDGNGPSTVNIIAGTTTLSGNGPTARQLELDEETKIAAAAAASAEAAAEQTSADAFNSQLPIIASQVATLKTTLATDKAAADAADQAYKEATDELNTLNVAVASLQTTDLIVDLGVDIALAVAGPAQAIPIFGDGGANAIYASLKIAEDAVRIALGAAQVAAAAQGFKVTELGNADVAADILAGADNATLQAELLTQQTAEASAQIADAAAANALLASETASVVSNQAIAARDQANVIGSPSDPLGLQVTGAVNVTAGPTDSYLQVVGNTALDQISATGSVTLISTGAITNGAAPGTPNILATGLTIVAANGIGTAANPLVTRVGTLNATNTNSGAIVIDNTAGTPAALAITGISNSSGGDVTIVNKGNAAADEGINVTGPISANGTGTNIVTLDSGSPLTIFADMTSPGPIVLSAAESLTPGDDLTVVSGVTVRSTGSTVTLQAGDNVYVQPGSTIEASGAITITADHNHNPAETAGANVVVEGTLVATSALIDVDPGDANNDTFTITPSVATPITVTGGTGSNTLNFNADGLPVTIIGNTITAAGRQPVTFNNIAAVNLLNPAGGGSVILDGTTGAANVMVLTGSGQGAGTFTLNGGVPFSFSGVTDFTFNGANLDDQSAVTPFATPALPWNVAVAINGGAGANLITFNGVSGLSESIAVQPSAPGAGQIIDNNEAAGTPIAVINYTSNTDIIVDGSSPAGAAGDTDSLTLKGTDPANPSTSGNDTFNADFTRAGTPGNGWVQVSDSNGGASLYNLRNFNNFNTINLAGLAGDDTFDVTGRNAAAVTNYGPLTVNVDGGLPDGSDTISLPGTANANDAYSVTPGASSHNGVITEQLSGSPQTTIKFLNVEKINVDGGGGSGNDALTVNGTGGDDTISAADVNSTTGTIQVNAGPVIQFANPGSTGAPPTSSINVQGNAGNDTFQLLGTTNNDTFAYAANASDGGTISQTSGGPTVNFALSNIQSASLDAKSSADNDTLAVTTANATITPGSDPGSGIVQPVDATGASLLPLSFSNVENASVTGAAAVIQGTAANDTIEVLANGKVQVTNALGFSNTIDVSAFNSLVINSLAGDDNITIDAGAAANFPGGIQVIGGDPSASDVVNFTGDGNSPVTVDLGSGTVQEMGFSAVTLSGVETLNIDANGAALNVNGSAGNDNVIVTPTGGNAGTLQDNGSAPVVNYKNAAANTVNVDFSSGGSDTLTVNASASADAIAVNVPGNSVNTGANGGIVDFSAGAPTALTVNGLQGSDTFNVTPGAIPVSIDGGDPIGVDPPLAPPNGDQINILAGGGSAAFSQGPHADEGGFVIGANQPVSFTHIERATVANPGTVVISGTSGDDTITVTAIDASNEAQFGAAGADGVQDYAVQMSNALTLAFIDSASLQINSLAGNDHIVVQAPAPGNENWNVAVGIDGGPPVAGGAAFGDNVSIETLGTAAQTVSYSPSSSNGGVVGLSTISSTISLTNVENLVLNGNSNNDPLTINGSGGADAITATPGPATDGGVIQVGNWLGLTYQALGGGGSVTINANGGSDTLTVYGTSANDVFSVSNTGTVTLNANLPLQQAGVANLALNGLGGDDTFNLIGGLPYSSTAINGGEPSASDIVNLSGATGLVSVNLADATLPSDTTISGYGGIVTLSGVEVANLDATGNALTVNGTAHDDALTYTPSGASDGSFAKSGLNTLFNFANAGGAFTVTGGAGGTDQLTVAGSSTRALFEIDQGARTVQALTHNTVPWKTVTIDPSIATLIAQGNSGQDTFQVIPAAGIGAFPLDNLLIDINGDSGPTGANNALVIGNSFVTGVGTPTPLPATSFVVDNRGRDLNSGTIRVFQSATANPDINFANVQIVSPTVASPANLLSMGPDVNEPNETQPASTNLASAGSVQVAHATIFSNNTEFPGVAADNDFYSVTAQQTGTLDFVAAFRLFNPALLPGGGNINLQALDAAGNVIATASGGAATFGAIGSAGSARIRIPAVAGQTYFLHVFGANPDGTPNANVVNGYDLSIVDTPAVVPSNLELSRSVPPGVAGNPDTGDLPPTAPGDDTGRSQLDDVTHDNTPRIYVRLSDGIFLNDLPGNGASDAPPVGVIPIPFSPNAATAGFRVAIFDGNDMQNPVGFATPVAGFPGLYQFDFTTPLADGVHHLTAEVQMVDPANPAETGFGGTNASLDLTIDTAVPPVAFGSTGVANSGLDGPSDSGVTGQPATLVDRITNASTPTFYGVAEANAIVRLYDDVNNNGVVDAGDVFLGQTTAAPIDGTNANPGGQWRMTSNVDLNNPKLGFPLDGVRHILVNAEDLAGNVSAAQKLAIFVDTQGPTVNNVSITGSPGFNLFADKPNTPSPTPLINSLEITFNDQPIRVGPNFVYPAVNQILATTPGNYQLVGEATGAVTITSVTFSDTTASGTPGMSVATLHFAAPLPDDRYTLTISDRITDNAANKLDGEFGPSFPSGNGTSGGNFVGQFTVDSRPELAVYSSGSVSVDLNGNFTFDPQNPDAANRDAAFTLGFPSDRLVAGKFADSHGVVNGFDKLGAYGFLNGQWRWLLDLNGDGAFDPAAGDISVVEPLAIDGLPVAGNWTNNPAQGDQIGLFDGTTWWLDMNNDHVINNTDVALGGELTGDMKGLPIVGDFDGDGKVDLGTYTGGMFYFDLSSKDPGGKLTGNYNATIDVQTDLPNNVGFAGVLSRPVAADMNHDGITDIGLFVPGQAQNPSSNTAQWYWLISDAASGGSPTAKFNSLNHPFDPTPLGRDLYAGFGSNFALPLVGNFDPPPSSDASNQSSGNGWIQNMYLDVLGRQASSDEAAYWTDQVSHGVTPAQIATLFLTSTERRSGVINAMYQQYMGRQADQAGIDYWISVWDATGGPEVVQAGIIGSPEYYKTAGNTDAAWVTELYKNILGRDVDPVGLAYWTSYIKTHSKQSVVLGFVTSDEYRLGLINGWFQIYLGRQLDSSGAQYWLNQMKLGETQEQIQAGILGSDEFRNHA